MKRRFGMPGSLTRDACNKLAGKQQQAHERTSIDQQAGPGVPIMSRQQSYTEVLQRQNRCLVVCSYRRGR